MKYQAYAQKDADGKAVESRKVRKAARHQRFADNKHLHSKRAKAETKASLSK